MVKAMLAILKAGGAYVPIDPGYPAARRSLMLEGVSVVVTIQALARGFASYTGRILWVEDEPAASAGQGNLSRLAHGGNLAYVIYTSGSTGQPKGVAIPHRAVNRLVLRTNYIALEGSDVVAQTSNCCFDAATFEIWGALLNGARLVVLDRDVTLSPADFAEELRRRGITTLWLTTPLFNLMAQHAPGAIRRVMPRPVWRRGSRRAQRRSNSQAWRAQTPHQFLWAHRDDDLCHLSRSALGTGKRGDPPHWQTHFEHHALHPGRVAESGSDRRARRDQLGRPRPCAGLRRCLGAHGGALSARPVFHPTRRAPLPDR